MDVQEHLLAAQFRSQRNIYITGFSLFLALYEYFCTLELQYALYNTVLFTILVQCIYCIYLFTYSISLMNTHTYTDCALPVLEVVRNRHTQTRQHIYGLNGYVGISFGSVIKRLVALILERAKLEANAAALERQARQAAIAAGLAQPPAAGAGAGAGAGAKAPREPDVGGDKKSSSSSEDAGALKAEMRRAEDLQLKLDAAVTGAPAPPSALRIICAF